MDMIEDVKTPAQVVHADYTHVASIEYDAAEEKKLVRKIDLYLMPAIFVLYVFSFVDRSNIGLAYVAGMQKDLALTPRQYYLAVIMWVIGYVIAAVPSNMILSRARTTIFLPIIVVLWGAVAAIIAAVTEASHLLVLRFFLGVFEAGFSPAVLYIISVWYRKHEQSKRFFIFLSAGILSGAFGGVAAGAITSKMDGAYGIRGWRWLFLVEGVATVGAGLAVHWVLLDLPGNSKRLSPRERQIAEARLTRDKITNRRTEGGHIKTITKALVASASNWQLWLLVPAYMTIIGALAIAAFYPMLVKGLGYNSTDAQYMTAPLYIVALFVALPVCWIADRYPRYRALFTAAMMAVGCIFSALTAGIDTYSARYAFLCIVNSCIWTCNALGLSFASTALASVNTEVRAISLAIMNGLAALAQLYGSALFPDTAAPKYLAGFGTFAGTFFLGGCLYLAAHFLFQKYPFKTFQPDDAVSDE